MLIGKFTNTIASYLLCTCAMINFQMSLTVYHTCFSKKPAYHSKIIFCAFIFSHEKCFLAKSLIDKLLVRHSMLSDVKQNCKIFQQDLHKRMLQRFVKKCLKIPAQDLLKAFCNFG